jgi:hypothetical protein
MSDDTKARAEGFAEGIEAATRAAAEYAHTDDGDVYRIALQIVAAIRALKEDKA